MLHRARIVLVLAVAVWHPGAELSAQPAAAGAAAAANDKASSDQAGDAAEAARLKSLWEALGSADFEVAEQAVAELAKLPALTIQLAEQRLAPLIENQGQAIQALIRALDADKYANREAAQRELAVFGPVIRPQLRQALTLDPKPEPYRRLERLLAAMPESVARSADERRWTRLALLVMGIDTPGGPALQQALAPAAGLLIIDPRVLALAELLDSTDPQARANAALNLIEMGQAAAPMLPKLIGMLADEGPLVPVGRLSRSVAAHVEAALPQLGAMAVQPLIAALKDQRPRVRIGAAAALARLQDPRAIEPLIDGLADAQTNDSARAALEKFGPQTAEPLLKLLDSPNPLVRRNATYILGRLKAPQALEPLAKMLEDDDPILRQYAIDALQHFGPAAFDHLLAAFKSGSLRLKAEENLRQRIITAIGINKGPRAIDQLLATAADEHEQDSVRATAVSLLQVHLNDLGSDPRLEKVLVAALAAASPQVRAKAPTVLGQLAHYRTDFPRARAVDLLVAALDDSSDDVKRAAISALGNWRDPRPIDRLLELLTDDRFRLQAAQALGQIGDRRAIEPLRHYLGEKNPAVIAALGKLGDRDSLEAILPLVNDSNQQVRGAAIDALGDIGGARAVEPLLAALAELSPDHKSLPQVHRLVEALGKTKDPRAAQAMLAAARRLADTGTHREPQHNPLAWPLVSIGLPAVEPLAQALADPSADVRELASWVLYNLIAQRHLDAQDLQPAVEALASALVDSSEVVRHHAALTLGLLKDRRAVGPLIETLAAADESHPIYYNAPNMLGALRDPDSFDQLVKLLSHERPATRVGAIKALANWADPRAIEPLVARLDDKAAGVRAEAATALSYLKAQAAVKPLLALLADKESLVRRAAATTLGRLGDKQAADALATIAEDSDFAVRLAAGLALLKLDDARGLPIVAQSLAGPDLETREAAATEIAISGVKNPALLPALTAALDDPAVIVRLYAALAVGNIGTPAAVDALAAKLADRENLRSLLQGLARTQSDRALAILIERLDDTDPKIRAVAAASLDGFDAERAVPALVKHLGDSASEVRLAIVQALTRFASKAAIEPLTAALQDDDPQVRLYAARALHRIEK